MSEGSGIGYDPSKESKNKKGMVGAVQHAVTYNVPAEVRHLSTGSLRKDTIGYLTQGDKYVTALHDIYGSPVVAFAALGGNHAVDIADANAFTDILDDRKTETVRIEFVHDAIDDSIGSGLPATKRDPEGSGLASRDYHRDIRKSASQHAEVGNPHSSSERSRARDELTTAIIGDQMQRVGDQLTEAYERAISEHDVAEVDISRAMVDYTFNAVVGTMFGVEDIHTEIEKMNAASDDEFPDRKTQINGFDDLKWAIRKSNERISAIVNMGGKANYLANPLNHALERDFKHAVDILDTYAYWMDEHAPLTNARNGEATYMAHLHGKYGGDNPENRQARLDQLKGMTIAGFETTAITLVDALFRLNSDSEMNEKLREAFLNGDEKTIENFFYEFTRLNPGIPRLTRALNKPKDIEITRHGADGEITTEKITLPAGTLLTYMVREGNKDPKQWNDNPEEFDPDRWNTFRDAMGHLKTPESYMSFGAKQTACIGENFAKKEFEVFMDWYYKQPFDIVPVDANAPSYSGTPDIKNRWIIAETAKPKVKALLEPRPLEPGLVDYKAAAVPEEPVTVPSTIAELIPESSGTGAD